MDTEEKLLKIINSLSKEELIKLRDMIEERVGEYYVSSYVPSGDSVVIAEYARRFHYDETRKMMKQGKKKYYKN